MMLYVGLDEDSNNYQDCTFEYYDLYEMERDRTRGEEIERERV